MVGRLSHQLKTGKLIDVACRSQHIVGLQFRARIACLACTLDASGDQQLANTSTARDRFHVKEPELADLLLIGVNQENRAYYPSFQFRDPPCVSGRIKHLYVIGKKSRYQRFIGFITAQVLCIKNRLTINNKA